MKKFLIILTLFALCLSLTAILASCDDGADSAFDSTKSQATTDPNVKNEPCSHEYGEWTVKEAASCEKDGTKERKCSLCESTESESIKAKHNVEATGICSVCNTEIFTEGLEFTANDANTEYSVTGYNGTKNVIIIPEEYNGLPVTSIGESAFYSKRTITSITLPNTITSVGFSAFKYCAELTSLVIPDSVTSIGSAILADCTKLESVTIPFVGPNAENSKNYHFGYIFGTPKRTNSLTNSIPKSLKTVVITGGTRVALESFADCRYITSISLPGTVTDIGYEAFEFASSLKDIFFSGTKAQWEAITKGYSWDTSTDNYTVHCTDGDISKSNS